VKHPDRSNLRTSALFLVAILFAFAVCTPPAFAKPQENRSPALGKIKQANTAAIDCSACPRALAKAGTTARQALLAWGRFRIVDDPKQADVLFIFSANPYLGDYLTRQGPDNRQVKIDGAIMTVIDPHTGQELWSDSRQWGSLRVAGATKALIDELRGEMEVESKKWTLTDVFGCGGAPAYRAFAFLTPEAALAQPGLNASRIADAPDRLRVNPPGAPDFCRRAQLLIGAGNKIDGFEVLAAPSDTLDVAEILEQADHYDFTSGKDPQTQKVFFTARSKDRKTVIQFDVQGHRTILSRVTYFY
jgi:hypothetical protein